MGITGNLAFLVWFKYANFITLNLNAAFELFKLGSIPVSQIILPIGISFYTFHSISYLIDIYYKKAVAQKNILNMALYITLFSQLVAGPIIRYNVFAPQLLNRHFNFDQFSNGIERFIIGLGKKVLIANTLARFADEGFNQNLDHMSCLLSWLAALFYTFQIYFDFSGYSDMAIGLSKMFGFEFPENFNLPYTAKSIKDFWKRWHISLSSFFKDYLYIPLGGNRATKNRTYLNLLIVFILTGFWHGANFTFILWGLLHGFFLLIERTSLGKLLAKTPTFIGNSYTFLIVMLLWVPFRANDLNQTFCFYKSLIPNENDLKIELLSSYLTTDFIIMAVLAIILSFNLQGYFLNYFKSFKFYPLTQTILLLSILFLSALYLMAGSYNPFIYYQF